MADSIAVVVDWHLLLGLLVPECPGVAADYIADPDYNCPPVVPVDCCLLPAQYYAPLVYCSPAADCPLQALSSCAVQQVLPHWSDG